MIDSYLRAPYQKVLVGPIVKALPDRVHPLALTFFSCLFGVLTLPLLLLRHPFLAIGSLLISGYLDTLDGSVARARNLSSPKGAALDILSDRAVESATILGLYFFTGEALPSLLMLASTLLCITSFLVVGIFTENTSEKSFNYSPGLIERAEAFAFFIAMILLPSYFVPLGILFSVLVTITALIRISQFIL